jgi:hypothetical protein
MNLALMTTTQHLHHQHDVSNNSLCHPRPVIAVVPSLSAPCGTLVIVDHQMNSSLEDDGGQSPAMAAGAGAGSGHDRRKHSKTERNKNNKDKDNDSNNDIDNDEAFLSLLSSQRQLLNRLNMEKKSSSSSSSSSRRQDPNQQPSQQQQQQQSQAQVDEQNYLQQQRLQRELELRRQGQHQLQHQNQHQMMNFMPPQHAPQNVQASHFFARQMAEQHAQHYQHIQNFLQMQQQQQHQPFSSSMNNHPMHIQQQQQLQQQQLQLQHEQQQLEHYPQMSHMSMTNPTSSILSTHMNQYNVGGNGMDGSFGFSMDGGGCGGIVQSDPFSLMNRSIGDRQPDEKRHSLDLLSYSNRRISMGLGDDEFVVDDEFNNLKDDMNMKSDLMSVKGRNTPSMYDLASLMTNATKSKLKRRRSSLGLLSDAAILFEDNPEEVVRRLSMSSRIPNHPSTECKETINEPGTQQQQQEDGEEEIERRNSGVRLDPNIDLPTLKGKIETFASAMDSSTKSQQDIHDWDRKMGLKRSHSKTMRLSMRSRKKLRATMKREMTTIYNATRVVVVAAAAAAATATATATATTNDDEGDHDHDS